MDRQLLPEGCSPLSPSWKPRNAEALSREVVIHRLPLNLRRWRGGPPLWARERFCDKCQGALVAYLRAVDPGVKYAEPSIGRVITAPEVRGTGLGRRLMLAAIEECFRLWGKSPIRISAQTYLLDFYSALGFVSTGKENLEDDIPHTEMLLKV